MEDNAETAALMLMETYDVINNCPASWRNDRNWNDAREIYESRILEISNELFERGVVLQFVYYHLD